ncbi:MAG: hypothetical protein ACRD0G_11365 [Acidimicrobiales bacterium]
MSNGFLVDYDALGDMAGVLSGLTDEFGGVEDQIDGFRGATGHDGVADALGDFSSNWSDDRGELVEKMENVAGFAQQAASCYADADQQICDGLVVEPAPAPPSTPASTPGGP